MRPAPNLPPEPQLRRHVMIGLGAVLFGFVGLLVWSLAMSLSGAVLASGAFVVESEVKRVQHQQGGIVASIGVRNGDRVEQGDLLLRLDDTIARTNLGQVVSQLVQLGARRARLEAERDDLPVPAFSQDYLDLGPETRDAVTSELRLLAELRATREAQKTQLHERIGQFRREIEGLEAQAVAKRRELSLIGDELKGVEELFQKNLVPITRLNALQREAARLSGETGQIIAAIAKARGQIAEIGLQIISIDQQAKTEAVRELRDVEAQISQLIERRAAAVDTLRRLEVRAPQSGIVHEQVVHTIGGIVAPGSTLMSIVPVQDPLTIEARVSPLDIDQVQVGQKAHVRLSAFNQRTTPELGGRVTRISPDVSRDQPNGPPFFTVRLEIEASDLTRLGGKTPMPGMPVETFIETGQRSAFSYLMKPLTDAFARAFREE